MKLLSDRRGLGGPESALKPIHLRILSQRVAAGALRTAASAALVLSGATSAWAQTAATQQRRPAQPTPQQVRTFIATFEANIEKGCLGGKPKSGNPQGFCRCYAASFTKRYAPNELVALNALVKQSEQAVNVVSVMMTPERRACAAANP